MSGCTTLALGLLLSAGAGTRVRVTRRPTLHCHGHGATVRAGVSSRALCLPVSAAAALATSLHPSCLGLSLSFGNMAGGRTVQDMLMQAARAQARGGRPPVSHKSKPAPAAVADMEVDAKPEASTSQQLKEEKKESGLPSVDDAVDALRKKQFDFDPKAAAFWKPGDHVPFLFLARAFDCT